MITLCTIIEFDSLQDHTLHLTYYCCGVCRYHTDATVLTNTQYLVATNTQGYEPVPDNALINGIGQAVGCTKPGPGCNYAKFFAKSSQIPLCTEAPVTTGKRWRLISMAAFGEFVFSIDEHLMAVTAADGIPVDPVEVSSININAAQRSATHCHYSLPLLFANHCFLFQFVSSVPL